MAGRTCALPGCNKPCADPHLACGEVHHLLLMAGRYNPSLPHPHQSILDRNASGLCALPSCSKSPWPGHSWCSRTHYLTWLSDFYANLPPHQICKLPGCPRHVFVDDTGDAAAAHRSQFCGWRHRQKFVMRTALEHRQPPPTQDNEGDRACEYLQRDGYGHLPFVKSHMHAFKRFALYGVNPESIKVDYDFFTKHPWEVLAAQCKFTWKRKNKQREMVTKDHYHWKQQGPPKEKSGFCRKYFTYRKLRSKNEEALQQCDEGLYTMKEYSMDDCKLYCLVKLCKGGYKQHKGKVHIGSSRNKVTPKPDHANQQLLDSSKEQFGGDSFYEELPSIIDLPYGP